MVYLSGENSYIYIEHLSFLKTPMERGENFRSPDIYIYGVPIVGLGARVERMRWWFLKLVVIFEVELAALKKSLSHSFNSSTQTNYRNPVYIYTRRSEILSSFQWCFQKWQLFYIYMNYLILSKINSLVTRMLVYLSGDNSYIYRTIVIFWKHHWKEERISDLLVYIYAGFR